MKLLVTGASGAIGRYAVPRLLKDGHELVLLAREPGKLAGFSGRCTILEGDVTQEKSLPRVRADCIVHLAGSINFNDETELFNTNALGTKNVLAMAKASGIPGFVYASSISVYGRKGHNGKTMTEQSPCDPDSYYGYTKLLGERTALEEKGMACIALRIGIVYGKGFEKGYGTMFKIMRKYGAFAIGPGTNRVPFVHASDVADAIALAVARLGKSWTGGTRQTIEKSGSIKEVYNISAKPVEQCKAVELAARALGLAPKIRSVPLPAAIQMLRLYNMFSARKIPIGYVETIAYDRNVNSEKAQRELGFTAKVEIGDGIAEMVKEYQENNGTKADKKQK